MIHINRVLVSVCMTLFLLATVPVSFAQEGPTHDLTCEYEAYGCNYLIVNHGDGTGTMYMSCDGDGYVYQGTGSFGSCPS
jgi:hypothetical protein